MGNDKRKGTPKTMSQLWLGILAHIVQSARKPPEEITTTTDKAVAIITEAPTLAMLLVGLGAWAGVVELLRDWLVGGVA